MRGSASSSRRRAAEGAICSGEREHHRCVDSRRHRRWRQHRGHPRQPQFLRHDRPGERHGVRDDQVRAAAATRICCVGGRQPRQDHLTNEMFLGPRIGSITPEINARSDGSTSGPTSACSSPASIDHRLERNQEPPGRSCGHGPSTPDEMQCDGNRSPSELPTVETIREGMRDAPSSHCEVHVWRRRSEGDRKWMRNGMRPRN